MTHIPGCKLVETYLGRALYKDIITGKWFFRNRDTGEDSIDFDTAEEAKKAIKGEK